MLTLCFFLFLNLASLLGSWVQEVLHFVDPLAYLLSAFTWTSQTLLLLGGTAEDFSPFL